MTHVSIYTLILFIFFKYTHTTEIYTLSLHDALPILNITVEMHATSVSRDRRTRTSSRVRPMTSRSRCTRARTWRRSEEHTSELQSHSDLVCRLLLEKKKKKINQDKNNQLP